MWPQHEGEAMKLNEIMSFVLLGTQAMLWAGCTTSKVWETGQFARFHEPAVPPNLRLFRSSQSQDLLVEYDEWLDSGRACHRRAYWLEKNMERVHGRRKPTFVSLDTQQGLVPVPILESRDVSASVSADSLYAIASTDGQAFTLFSGSKRIDDYELPVYEDASGRAKQVLLTPPAVVADVTIVGGIIAVFYMPYLWTSLNCVVH